MSSWLNMVENNSSLPYDLVSDPMPVDAHLEKNNEEESYEVETESFDLEGIVNNHTGLGAVFRLIYIADHAPKLRVDALKLAIGIVLKTLNINLYQILFNKLQACQGNLLLNNTDTDHIDTRETYDLEWVAKTQIIVEKRLEKLEAELKNYKSNCIKESIRRGYNETGDYYVNCGDFIEATKCYSKARDYCTSSVQVILMCINIVKVGVYLKNWSHVVNYLKKAEALPDYAQNSGLQTQFSTTIKCMMGLAELHNRDYKSAAQNFSQANIEHFLTNDIITPVNIAIYGGLCALATFDRAELKNYIVCNNSFKSFLELAPEIRLAILKFYETKYQDCLQLLTKIKPHLLLDMYIGSHINQLYVKIRNRAMIQYFSPYGSADMKKMAACFNTSLSDLENELVPLITSGQIKARIDSINKVLYAKDPDQRAETFERAMAMADQFARQMHIAILRSQMIKHQKKAQENARNNIYGSERIDIRFRKPSPDK